MSGPFEPAGGPAVYAARRARAAALIGEGALVLPAGQPTIYARDVPNRFRPDADFLYLTGLVEPQAVLVLRPSARPAAVLFVRARDPEREVWDGARPGPEGVVAAGVCDAAHPLGELAERLPELIDGAEPLYFAPWRHPDVDAALRGALERLAAREVLGQRPPRALVHHGVVLHELRLVKEPAELAALTDAARVTTEGIRAGLAHVRPGAREVEVQAAIEGAFLARGAHPGFATIVGAGANACVLHYKDNAAEIGADDLVLVDAGAEAGFYNGDATRTVPASGRFAPAQRALYDAVLDVQRALVAAVRPGATWSDLRALAARRLAAALVELKVLAGSVDEILENARHKRYTLHGPGHWLGLDVHDVGSPFRGRDPRPFEPGMVLTIEPGLYIGPDDDSAPPELRGQAVRIEDDVAVTAEGRDVLTRDLPTEAGAVAALVGAGRA